MVSRFHGFTAVCGGKPAPSSPFQEGVPVTNKDQIEGTVKEKVGETTDDESLEREGQAQGAWGDIKEKGEDLKEDLEERF
jgi:uncharacterized protein YjbJ (UPF0337 family)